MLIHRFACLLLSFAAVCAICAAPAWAVTPDKKPLTVLIFADMEGISGIPSRQFTYSTSKYYDKGCLRYTWDINVCVDACFKAGATSVIVRDGHGGGRNAVVEQVDPRVALYQGKTEERLPRIDECDGVIFLGYHAMSNTPDAFAAHTYSSKAVDNMWMNGRLAGEIGIDAGVAGDHGRPVIMVSGDNKACAEAAEWIPGVVTCQVKEGLTLESARLMPQNEAWKLIERKTIEAIGKIGTIKPVQVPHPVTIRKQMLNKLNLESLKGKPDVRIIDDRTTERTGNTVEEAYGF